MHAVWRKETKTPRPPAAVIKTTRHNKKDITGTVINTKKKKIKDAETSILSLNVHRNIQVNIHLKR